jgi:hypothetical protein
MESQKWLEALLRQATGINKIKVEDRPGTSSSVMVRLDQAIGSQSTERLSLHWRGDRLTLCTWPAELKGQARATYRTDRADRLMSFLGGRSRGWQAWPNVHLAYRLASIRQRVYLDCNLKLADYVSRWMEDDFRQVGGHHPPDVRTVLWPWLLDRGYAGLRDEKQLDPFLGRLGRRDAHLRPSIALQRSWSRQVAADLDRRDALASQIREAASEILAALDEPPLPARRGH